MKYNIGDYVVIQFINEDKPKTFAAGTIKEVNEVEGKYIYKIDIGQDGVEDFREVAEDNIIKVI